MKKLLVILAAVALVCAFTVPASAVDWNFYGSARMATWYTSEDFGDGLNSAGTDDSDDGTVWQLQGNTRIGARVKGETTRGRFELGMDEDDTTQSNEVLVRLLFGTWNFGAGTLKVGKDYTPTNQFISSSAWGGAAGGEDANLLNSGTFYGDRRGHIGLSIAGFEIALVNYRDASLDTDSDVAGAGGGDQDNYLPKIEASYGMAFDNFNFTLQGGYQTFTIEDVVSEVDGSTNDVDVDSYVVGAHGGVNLGPVALRASAFMAQNGANAGWSYSSGAGLWDGDDDINDMDTIGAALVGVFSMSDMLAFEAGVGYRNDDRDGRFEDGEVLRSYKEDETIQYYLQALIRLAPGVTLQPEVGFIDLMDDDEGEDEGESFYLGAKWQIDF
jgi:hypothetical protein